MLPNKMGCLAGVEARDQAAVELQVSFVLLLRLYSAHRCAAETYRIRMVETVDSALVDRIGPQLLSSNSTPSFSYQKQMKFLIDRY